MVYKHYEDPLRITLKTTIPTDDILCVMQPRNIIPDFDIIIRVESGGEEGDATEYIAKCRDGVLENCQAHYTYDRQLIVLISAVNHGLGLGRMTAQLILYGFYGQCMDCPEPIFRVYKDLNVTLVDDPSKSDGGSELSADLATSFVAIARPNFHIHTERNPMVIGELSTVIQEWSPELADSTRYKVFLLRKRRKGKRGTYWAIPEFVTLGDKRLKMTSWPISSTSAKQPIFMGVDGDWTNKSPAWESIREDGGYYLGDVIDISARLSKSKNVYMFANGRRKMTIGFAIFRFDFMLNKWVPCSNIATVDILLYDKDGIATTINCCNR